MGIIMSLLRLLLTLLYRVEVTGLAHFSEAGKRALIVANHTSFLDALLIAAYLPGPFTFAVNTYIVRAWWIKPVTRLVRLFPMDPAHPLSIKSLIGLVRANNRVVIFPEGRITVTGSLMKVYQGPGLVADKAGAAILPVRIDGAQYTPFSRLRGRARLRWFPKITITVLPPRHIDLPDTLKGRTRRDRAGKMLADIMTETIFATSNYRRTVVQGVLDAMRVHGPGHQIAEDAERRPVSYRTLFTRAFALGGAMARHTRPGEYVGLLLPNSVTTVISLLGLHLTGRVPAMLNYTVGARAAGNCLAAATVRRVFTSRRFITAAGLEKLVEALAEHADIIYLEDLRDTIGPLKKLRAWVAARMPYRAWRGRVGKVSPDDPAVVLFTSGSEGTPKGVVLSHANLLANQAQLNARIDFSARDVVLNALPMFHSFGLTGGTLLPLLSGIRAFYYPSPLHYRIIPELTYEINATILFGTNTFLAGYARHAHPYDFYSIRYVFAGAERLADDTRRAWIDKFGLRIFEAYGATETAPGLTTNTPMDYRAGTVGRLLPGIETHLEPVPGIEEGGRLEVRGPNIMLGYLLADNPGVLVPPATKRGPGWYDTGDVVAFDEDGYLSILGRAKRFAKVGGEMVSLAAAEQLAGDVWPGKAHAVVAVLDKTKGERLVLLTEHLDASRQTLLKHARSEGVGEIMVPQKVMVVATIPLLGTGKIDYAKALELATKTPGDNKSGKPS